MSLAFHHIDAAVRRALAEDLGDAGDITTAATVPVTARSRTVIAARKPGVIAGVDVAKHAFAVLSDALSVTVKVPDGTRVTAGEVVLEIAGPAHPILSAERVALNFLGHLSGVATATAEIATAIAHTKAKVCCTRKTTPGLRALEKYAVRCGGGVNHRFGLYDAVLIKDNHIAAVGGVAAAVKAARLSVGHMVKIEAEVDHISQIDEAITAGADVLLLDNMTPAQLADAVKLVNGRAVTEASGSITKTTAAAIAESGVDLMSAGWITHSAPCLDLGLDFK
ncbi:MAG: carboxylating nicotinate-nucleotide diphosphorylase [Rhodospirillaceae bacterium]|nr:carboxylating nicotinate-nucleotide diphosphorylase [Rhodospirillaceae bacterium]